MAIYITNLIWALFIIIVFISISPFILIETNASSDESDNSNNSEVLVGAGSSAVESLMISLLSSYLYSHPNQQIKYYPLSSARGVCRVFDYKTLCNATDTTEPTQVDFAITESPLSSDLAIAYYDSEWLPFVALPFVPVYNLPGIPTNETLVLTPQILARIFTKCDQYLSPSSICASDSIHYWNDTDIVALNPQLEKQLNDAGEIFPVVRKGSSGSTWIIKSSLAKYTSNATEFALQVPIDTTDTWGTTVSKVIKKSSSETFPFVASTPSTIALASLSDAMREGSRYASLKMSNSDLATPITASTLTADAAVTERGAIPLVENIVDQHDLEHVSLSIGLWGGKGSTSWPIIGYTYMIFREVQMREGTSCGIRVVWIEFLEWLYTHNKAKSIIHELGFGALNTQLADNVFNHFRDHLRCGDDNIRAKDFKTDGSNQVSFDPSIFIFSSKDGIGATISSAVEAFNTDRIQGDRIELEETNDPITSMKTAAHAGSIAVIPALNYDELLGEDKDKYIAMPFAAVGAGVIYNLCDPTQPTCAASNIKLALSVDTVADILNGEITMWNDARIAAHLSSSDIINLPNQPIQVLKPVPGWDTNFAEVINHATGKRKTVTYAAGSIQPGSAKNAASLVKGKKYSFALIPAFDSTLTYASLVYKDHDGIDVTADLDLDDMNYCMEMLFNVTTMKFQLDDLNKDFEDEDEDEDVCYPFLLPIYMSMRKKYTGLECKNEGGIAAAKFLQRFFGLNDADFFFGVEEFNTKTGESTTNERYNVETAYNELNLLRKARNGIGKSLQIWNMISLVVPEKGHEITILRQNYMNILEEVNCEGSSIVKSHQDLNEVSDALTIGISVIVVLFIIIYVFSILWVIRYRNARIIKNNSPIFLLQILVGAIIGFLSIPFFRIKDGTNFNYHARFNSQKSLFCNAPIILLGVGYAIMISALYVKLWRIVQIFTNPELIRFVITDKRLLLYQFAVVAVFCIELFVGYAVAPLKYIRVPVAFNPIDGNVIDSYGFCESENPYAMFLPFFITMLVSVLYGNYLAYKSKDIPGEFSEGTWMAISLLVMLQAIVFGLPVIALTDSTNPTVSFFSKFMVVFIIFCIAPSFLFIPKFLLAYGCMKSEDDVLKLSNSNSNQKLSKTRGSKSGELKSGDYKSNNSANALYGTQVSKTPAVDAVDKTKVVSKIDLDNASMANLSSKSPKKKSMKVATSENENPPVVNFDQGRPVSVSIAMINPEPDVAGRVSIDLSQSQDGYEAQKVDLDRLRVAPWLLTPPKKKGNKNAIPQTNNNS